MTDAFQTWLLVGFPENFEVSRNLGFTLQGIKSRHRKKAEQVKAGDRIIYYLTGLQALGGIAEVTGAMKEDLTPIWRCSDTYPFRVPIKPELILPDGHTLPVITIKDDLQYLKKWPEAHWRLGFQGNIHAWPMADYEVAEAAIRTHATTSDTIAIR